MSVTHATLTAKPNDASKDVSADAWNEAHSVTPDTIANILSDHDKTAHDALGIDADTVDGSHASAFATSGHDHAATYAPIAKGVTNGDSHDHSGGDGAQIDHGGLTGLSDDDHIQYLRADGTRGLSANWDAGSFEIRAQTLESDVATGTAPLTIASTTKVTNLNADLLDGLHDTGYTKTTAGQTINVSTAAELTAALATLAASPSLLGNVTISLASGTYSGTFNIPTLIYNGFILTLIGSYTTNLSKTATGGDAGSGINQGTATVTSGLGVNTYQNKFIRFDDDTTTAALRGIIRVIDSHTDTTITICAIFPAAPVNGDTFDIITVDSNVPNVVCDGVSHTVFDMINFTGATTYSIDVKNLASISVYRSMVATKDVYIKNKSMVLFDTVLSAKRIIFTNVCAGETNRMKIVGQTNQAIYVVLNSAVYVLSGTITDAGTYGLMAVRNSSIYTDSDNTRGYCRIRNHTTAGCKAESGSVIVNTAQNQYSGNLADEVADAYSYID